MQQINKDMYRRSNLRWRGRRNNGKGKMMENGENIMDTGRWIDDREEKKEAQHCFKKSL